MTLPASLWPWNKIKVKGTGDGGGFFIACEDFGRMLDHSIPACTCCFFSFRGDSSCTLIPLYNRIGPQWLGELWQLWQNVPCRVACELVSWLVPSLCLHSSIVSPIRLRWVKGVCMFWCNLPPALLAESSGSFTCNCGNMGVERTLNKSQHRKLTLEKKIPPRTLLLGFKLTTFWLPVWRSTQQAIPALGLVWMGRTLWKFWAC